MHIVLWILLCFFVSIGAVQALAWIICGLGRPKKGPGRAYQVIPLENDPELLEEQLRYEMHLLRWGAPFRHEVLILLDTGLDEESKEICRNLLNGMSAVIVCSPQELAKLIALGSDAALVKGST